LTLQSPDCARIARAKPARGARPLRLVELAAGVLPIVVARPVDGVPWTLSRSLAGEHKLAGLACGLAGAGIDAGGSRCRMTVVVAPSPASSPIAMTSMPAIENRLCIGSFLCTEVMKSLAGRGFRLKFFRGAPMANRGFDDVTIFDAMDNAELWRLWFKDPETWSAWRVFLAALFGLPLRGDDELALYQRCTERKLPPAGGTNEAWLICGRRSGKSVILALVAVFLAVFRDWSDYLVPGERGAIKVMAADRRQARIIHRLCRALLMRVPALAQLVLRDGDDTIELDNRHRDPDGELADHPRLHRHCEPVRRNRVLAQ
jgi:hypothetical protein